MHENPKNFKVLSTRITMKDKVFIVRKEHKSNYPNPLILHKGDKVLLGKEYSNNPNWKNWVWCQKIGSENTGWVPKQIIQITNDTGIVLEDYSANELNVQKNEKVTALRELNGWIWCLNSHGKKGWVPKENLE